MRDPLFAERKALAERIELMFPRRFIPRYSMVMFHAEISYAEALRRGALQERLLDGLLAMARRAVAPDREELRRRLDRMEAQPG